MQLISKPTPQLSVCDRKVFRPDEYHCTRVAKDSVLILMESGVLRFREDGRDVELTRGEYYIQREGLLQEGVLLGENPVYYYFHFFGTYSDLDEGEGVPLHGRFDPGFLLPMAKRCVDSFYDGRASHFLLDSYLLRIFAELTVGEDAEEDRARTLERMRDYLESNYATEISQEALALRFGYSQNHMIRLFREKFGITPHRFVTELRMSRARWLLENTALSVAQVAATVGYADASVFYRRFTHAYGVSPGGFKREAGEDSL